MTRNFEVIKLDYIVFQQLDRYDKGYIFIDALRQIAAEAGALLLIEGVETSKQFNDIKKIEVWAVQGFYWEGFQL